MKATKAIITEIYPLVTASMGKNVNKFKKCVGDFMQRRSKELYDIAPCDRIYFGQTDLDEFYKATELDMNKLSTAISHTYYAPMANFNPRAAKDEFTVAMMMIIRYFYLKNMKKECELASIYLAFSGKFYPSVHSGCFPLVQPSEYRHVMEYVVNNKLSQKFDLKREGSVFGAVRSICNTWINSYASKLKEADDEDIVYLIQQLHDRIKSFMQNIARLYYEVYENKDAYLTYDSDSMGDEDYRLADNDSLKAERVINKTMEYVNSTGVDYKFCKMASDSNVKTTEVQSIIESILSDNTNLPEVKELLTLLVTDYFLNSKTKDVRDVAFITYSIKPKPNAKEKNVLRQKEIVEHWLEEGSPQYRKRKSREATKSSYFKSVFTYFVLTIHNANK